MDIPLEKRLTISATEYCEMVGKSLSDYLPIEVSTYEKVPKGTEIVVECKYFFRQGYADIITHGTALIPKKEKSD